MDKNLFWELIDSVNREVPNGDHSAVLQATREKLYQLPSTEIAAWYKLYNTIVNQADRRDLWQVCDDCGIHASDDGFYYFRAWLVSQGRDVYTAVLNNPQSLPEFFSDPENASFEAYNYVSWSVYSQKASEEHFGIEGLKRYYAQWRLENLDGVDSSLMRPGETRQEYSLRLFRYHLEEEFDIFEALEHLPALDEQVASAAAKTDITAESNNIAKHPLELDL